VRVMSGRPTAGHVAAWADELDAVVGRIGRHFDRSEPRRRATGYIRGLLSTTERKNGWQLAEHLGDPTPDGVQHLLARADWDADAVRDDLLTYVAGHLGDAGGVLVVDETGFLKKGHEIVRGGPAVLGHGRPDRELPGRRLPRVRHPPRPGAAGPGAVPAQGVGRRRTAAAGGRGAGGGAVRHQAGPGAADGRPGPGRRGAGPVGDGGRRVRLGLRVP